jgi:hypothetical protein
MSEYLMIITASMERKYGTAQNAARIIIRNSKQIPMTKKINEQIKNKPDEPEPKEF